MSRTGLLTSRRYSISICSDAPSVKSRGTAARVVAFSAFSRHCVSRSRSLGRSRSGPRGLSSLYSFSGLRLLSIPCGFSSPCGFTSPRGLSRLRCLSRTGPKCHGLRKAVGRKQNNDGTVVHFLIYYKITRKSCKRNNRIAKLLACSQHVRVYT